MTSTTLRGTLIAQATVPGTDVRIRIQKIAATAGDYFVTSVNVTDPGDDNYAAGQARTEEEARVLANAYWTSAVKRRDRKVVKHVLRVPHAADTVPAGRYAVEVDGKLGFFKVDQPTEGRWAGYTFVKQMASDTEYAVRGDRKDLVLSAIANAPQAASVRYGREIGACGVCGRTLTDEGSRARGIGPICADKMGW